MKYEIVANSCRICLQKSKKLRPIYQPTEEGEDSPNEMLKQLTGIDLDEELSLEISLPKNICRPCELSLNMAFQFRIKALTSQRVLEMHCEQFRKKGDNSSTQGNMFEVKEEYIDINDNADEFSMSLEAEVLNCHRDIKMEKTESPLIYESAELNEYKDEVEYLDELYLDVEINRDAINCNSNEELIYSSEQSKYDEENETCSSVKSDDNKSIEFNSGECVENPVSNDDQIFSKKVQNSLIIAPNVVNKNKYRNNKSIDTKLHYNRERKLKTRHENHICDVCGNIYAKRGRMMEHRRRHNNDLSYACELCDKKFNFREMLRKHMFMHSGGKPYKCSFCSRTFFYESVKKAHEAVHSGYKPYVCEECNKAFAYAHALKKHQLIHADIKLYHCDYCNKDFRLQHHMKQHEETKTHQNAVRMFESSKLIMINDV